MAWLTQLADVARRTGRPVVEVAGWKTCGHATMGTIQSVACHHTVDNPPKDYPSLAIVRDGRPDLAGPLAHFGIGRSGTIYVIAAGLCWHAGATFESWQSNSHSIGIEAANNGTTEPWTEALMLSYRLLTRELAAEFGIPQDRILGHKEIAKPRGRKSDPSFDMPSFRASLKSISAVTATAPTQEGFLMSLSDADQQLILQAAKALLTPQQSKAVDPNTGVRQTGSLTPVAAIMNMDGAIWESRQPLQSRVVERDGTRSKVMFTEREALANLDAYANRAEAVNNANNSLLGAVYKAVSSSGLSPDAQSSLAKAIAAEVGKLEVSINVNGKEVAA